MFTEWTPSGHTLTVLIILLMTIAFLWINSERWFEGWKKEKSRTTPVDSSGTTSTKKWRERAKEKYEELKKKERIWKILAVVAGFTALFFIPYFTMSQDTWNAWLAAWVSIIWPLALFVAILVLGILLAPKKSDFFKGVGQFLRFVGTAGLAIFIGYAILAPFIAKWKKEEQVRLDAINSARTAQLENNARYWRNHIAENPAMATTLFQCVKDELGGSERDADLLMQIGYEEVAGLRQFEPDGTTPIKGEVDSDDTGFFQINKRIHKVKLGETGYDLATLEGQCKMAALIYKTQGPTAWKKYPDALAVLQGAPDAQAPQLARVEIPKIILASSRVVAKTEVCDLDNPVVIEAETEYSDWHETSPGGARTFITIPQSGVVVYQDQTGSENSLTGPKSVRYFLNWSDVKGPEGKIRFRAKDPFGRDTPEPVEVRMYRCYIK